MSASAKGDENGFREVRKIVQDYKIDQKRTLLFFLLH
jgi:hypothetical protein